MMDKPKMNTLRRIIREEIKNLATGKGIRESRVTAEEITVYNAKLARELDKFGVDFTYESQQPMSDEILLRIMFPSLGAVYAGYDRYGYVVDGPGMTKTPQREWIDQANLRDTVEYITKYAKMSY